MKQILITFTLLLTLLATPSYCSQDTEDLKLLVSKSNNKTVISWSHFKAVAFADTQKPKALFWELSNGNQTKNGVLPVTAEGTINALLAPNKYSFELRTCIVELQTRPIFCLLGPVQAHVEFTVEVIKQWTLVFNVHDGRDSLN